MGRGTSFLAACVLAFAGVSTVASASSAERIKVGEGIFLAEASDVADPKGSSPRAQRPGRDSRIVGGGPTTIQQYPWQAAITYSPQLYVGNGQARQFCGGSLVAPTLVITAAHCLADQSGAFKPKEMFGTITGRTVLSSSEGQESLLANYFVPTNAQGAPLYNAQTSQWDVAILQLATASSATPIRLAGASERSLWAGGRTSFVSGWGMLGPGGGFPDQLHAAQITMIDDNTCGSPNVYGPDFDRETMVCAGELRGGVDTCSGDSGGPLVVPAADGTMRLVGDTSFGPQDCGRPGIPGVYGRVADDPMRSVLENAARSLAGAEIVGGGGGGGGGGTLTAESALELTRDYAKQICQRKRTCRRSGAVDPCFTEGDALDSFGCFAVNLVKRRGRKFTCARTVIWSAPLGVIERGFRGGFQCSRGWRRP